LLLNYKRIPYTTEWVELHKIKEHGQAHGRGPTHQGLSIWTLPAIEDGTTQVVDSLAIAAHLEAKYPERPLITDVLLAEQKPHKDVIVQNVFEHIYPMVVVHAIDNFEGDAQVYYVESRPILFGEYSLLHTGFLASGLSGCWAEGEQLKDMYDLNNEALCTRRWKALETGMDALAAHIAATEHSGASLFSTAQEPVYVDFLLVCYLLWMEAVGPKDGWARMKTWNGGLWEQAYENCRPYMQVC
jgi:glutathione S-transferase